MADDPLKCQECEDGVIFHAGGRCIHTGEMMDDWEEDCPFCRGSLESRARARQGRP